MKGLHLCRGALLAAAVLIVSGCPLPIPPLGYSSESRTNLTDRVPEFIVKGETTRERVLLGLGVPDSHSPDGRWFAYRSAQHTGGIVFVVAAGSGAAGAGVMAYRERLLVVRFDANSVVVDATLEERICPRGVAGFGNEGGESSPCLHIPDPASAGALVDSDAGLPAAVYEQAVWASGQNDPLSVAASESRRTGRIVVTDLGVLAVADGDGRSGSAEPSRYWIPYRQIARARLAQVPAGAVCALDLKDGRTYSAAILRRSPPLTWRLDGEATRGLVERISRALVDQAKLPDIPNADAR